MGEEKAAKLRALLEKYHLENLHLRWTCMNDPLIVKATNTVFLLCPDERDNDFLLATAEVAPGGVVESMVCEDPIIARFFKAALPVMFSE